MINLIRATNYTLRKWNSVVLRKQRGREIRWKSGIITVGLKSERKGNSLLSFFSLVTVCNFSSARKRRKLFPNDKFRAISKQEERNRYPAAFKEAKAARFHVLALFTLPSRDLVSSSVRIDRSSLISLSSRCRRNSDVNELPSDLKINTLGDPAARYSRILLANGEKEQPYSTLWNVFALQSVVYRKIYARQKARQVYRFRFQTFISSPKLAVLPGWKGLRAWGEKLRVLPCREALYNSNYADAGGTNGDKDRGRTRVKFSRIRTAELCFLLGRTKNKLKKGRAINGITRAIFCSCLR